METKNIYEKLLEAQKEIGAIKKESDNPFFHSKYFDINAILREVKPILNKNGLLLTQAIILKEGKNVLTTDIDSTEKEEQGIRSEILLPEGLDPQKMGSAITYFRRYAIQSFLALEAEDDDGNSASGKTETTQVAKKTPVQKFEDDLDRMSGAKVTADIL